MTKFILLLFIICTGCSGASLSVDLNSTFAVDSSFTTEEQEQIVKALWNWEQATKGIVNMKLIITDTPNLYSGYTKIIKSDDWVPTKFGTTFYDVNHSTIYIYYRSIYNLTINNRNVALLSIAEHEMGHAFGLVHASSGIMSAPEIEQQCIDSFTLEQFCNIHYCSMSEVKSNCK